MRTLLKYLLACLCVLPFFTLAQNSIISAHMRKIAKTYQEAENLSIDLKVTTYKDKNDTRGRFIGNGTIRRSGKNYYSRLLTDEMLVNKKCVLTIDYEDREISCETGKEKRWDRPAAIPNMDSLVAQNDSARYLGVREGSMCFSFYSTGAPIVRTDMYVDPTTYFLRKIVYYYTPNSEDDSYDLYKMVIDYKTVAGENIDEKFFSESPFITYEKGKPRLTEAYKNYTLTLF